MSDGPKGWRLAATVRLIRDGHSVKEAFELKSEGERQLREMWEKNLLGRGTASTKALSQKQAWRAGAQIRGPGNTMSAW